ncbi:hypothetical protein RMQ97_09695 [Maricaulis sp. D1M11]|uniref:hypothetical protein n=1 Tax=Maricaulis sp. D1M11 TaxID=3076117 RepID=UPI0039B42087
MVDELETNTAPPQRARLSEAEWAGLWLRSLKGEPVRDIARSQGVSPGAVSTRFRNLRQAALKGLGPGVDESWLRFFLIARAHALKGDWSGARQIAQSLSAQIRTRRELEKHMHGPKDTSPDPGERPRWGDPRAELERRLDRLAGALRTGALAGPDGCCTVPDLPGELDTLVPWRAGRAGTALEYMAHVGRSGSGQDPHRSGVDQEPDRPGPD